MRLTIILIRFTVPAMYICLCNGHRESDIQRATQAGLRCVHAIYRELGGPPRCGRCLPVAKTVIARAAGVAPAELVGGPALLRSE